GGGDLKDLPQRRAIAKILNSKQTLLQKEYIENMCKNLDNQKGFCDEFLNISFWTKVSSGQKSTIYAEDICQKVMKTKSLSRPQYLECLTKIRKQKDLCLYPAGFNSGLRPLPDCDQLSMALNHGAL